MSDSNRIGENDFSNPATKALYESGWNGNEAMLRQAREECHQCGGCTWFAPVNSDYGVCLHESKDAPHRLETVFEHFTCAMTDQEGWGAHSFADKTFRDSQMPKGVTRQWAREVLSAQLLDIYRDLTMVANNPTSLADIRRRMAKMIDVADDLEIDVAGITQELCDSEQLTVERVERMDSILKEGE